MTAFGPGAIGEVMMVQWTVAAMPLGALVAGLLAAGIGVSATEFAAAAVIFTASAFTLIPRDIWTIRGDDVLTAEPRVERLLPTGAGGPFPRE